MTGQGSIDSTNTCVAGCNGMIHIVTPANHLDSDYHDVDHLDSDYHDVDIHIEYLTVSTQENYFKGRNFKTVHFYGIGSTHASNSADQEPTNLYMNDLVSIICSSIKWYPMHNG